MLIKLSKNIGQEPVNVEQGMMGAGATAGREYQAMSLRLWV